MIKLYVKNNCPTCNEVKAKLKNEGIPVHVAGNMSEPMGMNLMLDEVEKYSSEDATPIIRSAPVMICGKDKIYTGYDCIIAIEDREWES